MYDPRLETFLTVADSGSFNKAAEKLYITPTAVIKQINLLETSIDVKLFDSYIKIILMSRNSCNFTVKKSTNG